MTKMYLKDKLYTLKMRENDSVTKHIHTFRAHLEQLLVAGSAVPDDEAILTLMRSLPPSYKSFINSLRRQLGITLQSLITDLIQEEMLMKNMSLTSNGTSALYVEKKFSNFRKKPYFNKKTNIRRGYKGESSNSKLFKKNIVVDKKCFYCKKPRHLIKDCKTRIAAKRSNNKRETNVVTKSHKLYVVALLVNNKPNSTWYIDLGATQHMCHELEGFINYTKYENNQVVYLGDDSTSYTIKGCGDVNLKLLNGDERIIPDVLYIPGFAKN